MSQMTDQSEEGRKAEQARALDVTRPGGGMIQHSHLRRKQEVVGVTRDDLEVLLSFDGISAAFGALGMFMLSGAVWLIAENSLDEDGFVIDSLMSFCIACVAFGAVFLATAGFFHFKKRGRVKRIFDQTTPISDGQ